MSNHEKKTGDDEFDRPGQDQRHDADVDGMTQSRPTSPATGAAAAAAARAAYEHAPRGAASTEEPTPVEPDVPSAGDPAHGGQSDDDITPEAFLAEAGQITEPTRDTEPRSADAQLAAERLADYQRLNAEYVNYKRRVDRDRAEDRNRATQNVVESLLPVLDEIHFARQHGELTEGTPFAKIAAKLEAILAQYGVTMFGEAGETFDPMVHEALMHTTADLPEGTTDTTVVMVMQPGYRMGERVVRPARVSVADPA
ncbi:nucleotide exchange factor GrpE [Mobilicoccus massiliensis]|uniref:nucleotide exchange factor GrpE n=1 Tax=Mobilicoccus massiliensis TaxID=1522310 RepID=UPI00069440BD|nr:nucleotide exchange factor GrpE [Mobilicoccus massiliensis]